MTSFHIATDPPIVRRRPPLPRRSRREPLPLPRQVRLLGRLVRWLLSDQVPHGGSL